MSITKHNRVIQPRLFLGSSEQIIALYRMQQKKRLLLGLLAVTSLGWTSLCSALLAIDLPKQGTMTNDSRRDMITALEAASPHPSLGEQAHVFDQFIGTWECDYANFAENGTITRGKGEVMFGWILDGHAIQDVWSWTAEGDSGQRELVTDIRFFDSKSGKWRAVWVVSPFVLAINEARKPKNKPNM